MDTGVPEDLQRCQDGGQDVGHVGHPGDRAQRDGQSPRKAQQHVLHDGTVVVGLREKTLLYVPLLDQLFYLQSIKDICGLSQDEEEEEEDLVRVDDLLPQEGVLSSAAVKQAPVHLQVPD